MLVLFILLVLVALLLPPALLLRTSLHRRRAGSRARRSLLVNIALLGSFLSLGFNLGFLILRLGDILAETHLADGYLIIAVTLSWFCLFGRMYLKSTFRQRSGLERKKLG